MQHVTADSNIWISGLNWRGKPHEFLNLARTGEIQLAVSDAILDEFGRILHDKLEWSDERLNDMRAEVATFTKRISQTETLDLLKESGRHIAAREERKGPADNLPAYASVVARRTAALRVRSGAWAIANATLTGAASELALHGSQAPARHRGGNHDMRLVTMQRGRDVGRSDIEGRADALRTWRQPTEARGPLSVGE